jgi:hypothetical protein
MGESQIKKWSRVTGTDRETLKARVTEMYVEGRMSVRDIATETGRSYGATHRLLSDAGVPFRSRGNPSTR